MLEVMPQQPGAGVLQHQHQHHQHQQQQHSHAHSLSQPEDLSNARIGLGIENANMDSLYGSSPFKPANQYAFPVSKASVPDILSARSGLPDHSAYQLPTPASSSPHLLSDHCLQHDPLPQGHLHGHSLSIDTAIAAQYNPYHMQYQDSMPPSTVTIQSATWPALEPINPAMTNGQYPVNRRESMPCLSRINRPTISFSSTHSSYIKAEDEPHSAPLTAFGGASFSSQMDNYPAAGIGNEAIGGIAGDGRGELQESEVAAPTEIDTLMQVVQSKSSDHSTKILKVS